MKLIWNDIERLHTSIQGTWFLLGDFDNVLKAQYKIDGNDGLKSKYSYLTGMMDIIGLYEKDSICDYYTWSNKPDNNTIYSITDRVIGNLTRLPQNIDTTLKVTTP